MFYGAEETFVVVEGVVITGISNIDFDHSINEEAVNLLSNRGITRKINKPTVTSCAISRPILGDDIFFSLTGVSDLTGILIHGNSALSFTDAAIESYSLNVRANNNTPESTVNMKIFGDFKPSAPPVGLSGFTQDNSPLDAVPMTGLQLNIDDTSSAIESFEYNVQFDLKPTYEIESVKSSAVKILSPARYSCKASLVMLEEDFEDVTGFLETESYNRNLTFSLFSESGQHGSYEIPSGSKSSQSITAADSDLLKADFAFNGYKIF
jgi:hypothetical protein